MRIHVQKKGAMVCAVVFTICFFVFTPMAQGDTNEKVKEELLIKFKDSEDIYQIKIGETVDEKTMLEELRRQRNVEIAEKNVSFSIVAFPNDPFYNQQRYLDFIQAGPAWSEELIIRESRNSIREATIAVLDTGVDIDHPDLKENIWKNVGEIAQDGIDNDRNGYVDDLNGWDFIANVSSPRPKLEGEYSKSAVNHGTLISGIAAAVGNNSEGVTGISWHAKIMPLRVLDSQGEGNVLTVYRAIQYAIKSKADIINMSFVGDEDSELLRQGIKNAYDAGIIVVVAAGNSNPKEPGVNFEVTKKYPVCSLLDEDVNYVMGVASLDKNGLRSVFSNYGNNCVDISAPGEEIFGAQYYLPSQSEFQVFYNGLWSGTSLSAPMVSGSLALLKTVRPELSHKDLMEFIIAAATPFETSRSDGLGKGKLNTHKALELALKGLTSLQKAETPKEYMLVAALGFESFPQLKIIRFDGGVFKSFFPYSPTFKGPINVAVGNVDEDSKEEIVTGAGFGGGPHVRIFNIDGQVKGQFFAFDKNLRSGVTVSLGDTDGDGQLEIITGAGKGTKPEVRIYSKDGKLISSFLAYSERFLGGVNVASGDIDADGIDEIVTGPGFGGGPHVRVFRKDGFILKQFFAFNPETRVGAQVAVGDLNNDSIKEIVTAAVSSATPLIRVYRANDLFIMSEFLAFPPDFVKGMFLAVGDLDSDANNEIIAGAGVGGQAFTRVFDRNGTLKKQYLIHPEFYKGGVRVGVMKYGNN